MVAVVAPKLPKLLIAPTEAYDLYPGQGLPSGLWSAQARLNEFDSLLKEVYQPAIIEQLGQPNTLVHFLSMSPEELTAIRQKQHAWVLEQRIERARNRARARMAA